MEDTREQEENKIRTLLNEYTVRSHYKLNPDDKIVDRVVKGLAMRTIKFGYAYCPCRLVTGDKDRDRKIICPCVYHEEEIERDGECHCNLFVGDNYQGKDEKGE
ncbi:MAG: ferredoxin:thioredoxin reductase [Candidatus Brocadia carolinensis]|uniref:ferredoxin:thioredoxin reductase n=1 Tax=Candidatus Brocadia carolinensis TaxID=1004156 RepID=A0A1V4AP21_9BACT|nr:MAG: ferredoxin:thioredoxin reductase [Candidatus Brocadia caroliniensis]